MIYSTFIVNVLNRDDLQSSYTVGVGAIVKKFKTGGRETSLDGKS